MEKYTIKNLDCASCAAKIEDNIRMLEDVRFVNVNFAGSSIVIDTDNLDKVKERIKEIEPDVELVTYGKGKAWVTADEIKENKRTIIKVFSGILLLITGIIFRDEIYNTPFHIAKYLVFTAAYLVSGWGVIRSAVRNIIRGQVFNEHFLMAVATLGAFAIDQMPEAVAVMLFYIVGELFQDIAVGRSRKSIRSLLEIKPDYANLKSGSGVIKIRPEDVKIEDTIIVKAGEKIPLDGIVTEGNSFVDTAVLTGESVPQQVLENDEVLAGMINQTGMLVIEVKKLFSESSISRILDLAENATTKKAETEKFITTFAKYYTPVVVFSAMLFAVIPPLILPGATFREWIYRSLVVLVISCPCALVISIPLGYFGGIGRASGKGILIKGSNFLDALTKVRTMVFDKTGTLTKGEFKVSGIVASNGFSRQEILEYAALAEYNSNHPVAKSVSETYNEAIDGSRIKKSEEMSGLGIKAEIDGKIILAGNDRLLHREQIEHPLCNVDGTVVHIAIDNTYAGYIIISDSLKHDAPETIEKLKERHIKTVMLTGDNKYAAQSIAGQLKIDRFYSGLLPEDKVKHIESLIKESNTGKVAFIGDGINDAPVIARADVGIAMGALGSDVAIESADIVLMTDSPLKVVEAIDVAGKTRTIVWQNIVFALGVKMVFIVLGLFGVATMWEAVFGDMGVALIAVFNSIRILKV